MLVVLMSNSTLSIPLGMFASVQVPFEFQRGRFDPSLFQAERSIAIDAAECKIFKTLFIYFNRHTVTRTTIRNSLSENNFFKSGQSVFYQFFKLVFEMILKSNFGKFVEIVANIPKIAFYNSFLCGSVLKVRNVRLLDMCWFYSENLLHSLQRK